MADDGKLCATQHHLLEEEEDEPRPLQPKNRDLSSPLVPLVLKRANMDVSLSDTFLSLAARAAVAVAAAVAAEAAAAARFAVVAAAVAAAAAAAAAVLVNPDWL
jgi:hypothetical protein